MSDPTIFVLATVSTLGVVVVAALFALLYLAGTGKKEEKCQQK